LQRVARQYLTPENRTLYALLPSGTAPKAATSLETSRENPIQKFDLQNGLRLLVKEDHRLPFVEFRVVFKGGLLAENVQNNGVTQLTGKMLLKGTKTRSAEQIANEIESVGGSIDSYGGNNSFGVNAEVLSEDFATGLGLVADVLLNPSFPEEALERERDVQLATLRAQKDHLLQSGVKAMRRGLFGETGYGLDTLGNEQSVQNLKTGDLRAFHGQFARPNNCVLAVYGDVKPEQVKASVEKAFSAWNPAVGGPLASDKAVGSLSSVKRVGETRDKKQTVLVIGFRGSTLHDKDRYALELVQEACSDLGSRLFLRIREQLGLAYYVGAQNFTGLAPGYFAFYVGTMPEKAKLVEIELFKEVDLLRAEGLTEEELKRSKAKVLGQKKIARQDLGGFALTTALDELYGLGFSHSDTEDALYEGVTLDQVKQVARKYLLPEAAVVASVGPDGPGNAE
jgi:zinc protease